jgi:hypothetical protein
MHIHKYIYIYWYVCINIPKAKAVQGLLISCAEFDIVPCNSKQIKFATSLWRKTYISKVRYSVYTKYEYTHETH